MAHRTQRHSVLELAVEEKPKRLPCPMGLCELLLSTLSVCLYDPASQFPLLFLSVTKVRAGIPVLVCMDFFFFCLWQQKQEPQDRP